MADLTPIEWTDATKKTRKIKSQTIRRQRDAPKRAFLCGQISEREYIECLVGRAKVSGGMIKSDFRGWRKLPPPRTYPRRPR